MKVIVKDRETGIETEYPSIFKARRTLRCSIKAFNDYNGKIWRERYEINVVDN